MDKLAELTVRHLDFTRRLIQAMDAADVKAKHLQQVLGIVAGMGGAEPIG